MKSLAKSAFLAEACLRDNLFGNAVVEGMAKTSQTIEEKIQDAQMNNAQKDMTLMDKYKKYYGLEAEYASFDPSSMLKDIDSIYSDHGQGFALMTLEKKLEVLDKGFYYGSFAYDNQESRGIYSKVNASDDSLKSHDIKMKSSTFNNEELGVSAALYFEKNEYILAFKTDGGYLDDVKKFYSRTSTSEFDQQLRWAARLTEKLSNSISSDALALVGFSGGGALASYAGMSRDVRTYTFDSIGVNDVYIPLAFQYSENYSKLGTESSLKNVTNFYIPHGENSLLNSDTFKLPSPLGNQVPITGGINYMDKVLDSDPYKLLKKGGRVATSNNPITAVAKEVIWDRVVAPARDTMKSGLVYIRPQNLMFDMLAQQAYTQQLISAQNIRQSQIYSKLFQNV